MENLEPIKTFMAEVTELVKSKNMSLAQYLKYYLDMDCESPTDWNILDLVFYHSANDDNKHLLDQVIARDKDIKKIHQASIAIEALPPLFRIIARRYFFYGHTYKEIGNHLYERGCGMYDNPQISRMMQKIYTRLQITLSVVLNNE